MHEYFAGSDERGIVYRCVADKTDIAEDELDVPLSRSFSIIPVVRGAGGVFKIIAGTVLAVVGVVTHQTWLIYMGAALALGGVAQLLAPMPKNDNGATNENQYFDGPAQSEAQGSRVPFGYGRMIIGSKIISGSITVQDQYTVNPHPYIGSFSGGAAYA